VGITFYLNGVKVGSFYRGFRNSEWVQTKWAFAAPAAFDQAIIWAARTGDSSTMYVDDVSLRALPNGLVFDGSDSGTTGHPFSIGTYGVGRAKISAGDGIALSASNISNFIVQNLTVVGTWNSLSGSGSSSGVGIDIVNTQPGNSKLPFIRVSNVEAKGFRWAGVRISGWNGKSGFRDVGLVKINAHGNGDVGISFRGDFDRNSTTWAHENVFVSRSKAWGNSGIPDKGGNSGSGILICDVNGAAVERNLAYQNGELSNYADGGPVGIWAYDSNAVQIQRNESWGNCTGSGKDGAGFDLDGGVTNSTLQYNYAHDNDGPGFLLCQFSGARAFGKNVIRYNISTNDARENSYGAITLSGGSGLTSALIEHNTVYVWPASGASPSGVKLSGVGPSVFLRNNVIQTSGGIPLVDADVNSTSAAFNGNDYWPGGGSFKIRWNGASYSSLKSWRSSTAQEQSGSLATGLVGDPMLSGNVPDAASPLIDSAVTMGVPWGGYASSPVDYFGMGMKGDAADIGAAE